MAGEEGIDGMQTVDDALGVIESLDANAEPHLLGEAETLANRGRHSATGFWSFMPEGGHSIEIG